MATTCPKCRYIRKPADTAPDFQCPACGVIYHKYIHYQDGGSKHNSLPPKSPVSANWSKQARINSVILIIAFTFMSLFLLRENYYGFQAKNWPKTTGLILSSYVSSGGRSADSAHVNYQYVADGKTYRNDRISFGMLSLQGKNTNPQTVVDYYHNGKEVNVYYNQNNPENSVLELQTNYSANFIFLLIMMIANVITGYYRFFKKG
ncbi:MAG: DUF3592 domain-containing protein [Methylobacter sp.]